MNDTVLRDLIVIAGAPGSGKTTVGDFLQRELKSPYIDFGDVRNFHLDSGWTNQSPREEQMSFENLIYILENYFRYGYKNVILNDLEDFQVRQIAEIFADYDYLIATLITSDDEIAARVRNRKGGFTNVERAVRWNREIQQRSLLKNEFRIDNTHNDPPQTARTILQIAQNKQNIRSF